ncbi:MAG: hypothetical protein DRO94_04145 [Candidatus Altiarchaeales archaeon]|nr:MAG: hypothetical protein DRO95_02500 [Candidatus Altiarchaeales archaeon]RLI93902.1 MAG: hypothetical protein DRO94_04145 [Candidatus Altiarchaeales archaeon]
MKIVFIPCYSKADPIPSLKGVLKIMDNYRRIGIVTTTQHINRLEEIMKFLKENGMDPIFCGRILGCNVENLIKKSKNVDSFLYIGSGKFHPLGLSIKTEKPVFFANPLSNSFGRISEGEKERYLKRRKSSIAKSLTGKIFGIIVSTKSGQFDINLALEIKKKLEERGKKAFIFSGDEITPDKLLGFNVDAWINTACPRLVDDYFDKPVINPDEVSILLNLFDVEDRDILQ